jgi:hypothetical protein
MVFGMAEINGPYGGKLGMQQEGTQDKYAHTCEEENPTDS